MKIFLLYIFIFASAINSRAQRPEQFSENGMLGYKWKTGRVAVEPIYEKGGYFVEGITYVEKNKKMAMIDTGGKVLTPFKYDYVAVYHNHQGTIRVVADGLSGFIDKKGNEVIPCKYEEVSEFIGNRARVRSGGKYGYVDRQGKILLETIYDYLSDETNSYTQWDGTVQLNSKYGYFDTATCKEILPATYDGIGSFENGMAIVIQNGKSGIVSRNGKFIIPCKYDRMEHFRQGRALVVNNGKHGFIDQKDSLVIPFMYEGATSFYNGFTEAILNGKTVFVDTLNRRSNLPADVTKLATDQNVYKDSVSEGLRGVKRCEYKVGIDYVSYRNCYCAFIDTSNREVFILADSLSLDESGGSLMKEGLALVMNTNTKKCGYIDNKGKLVIPCTFDKAEQFSEGLAFAAHLTSGAYKIGYIAKTGKYSIILPAIYTKNYGGCYYGGEPFKNGKAKMILRENGSDCDRSDAIMIDKKGTITKLKKGK